MQTHPELARLRLELDEARQKAHGLAARAGTARWGRRPPGGGWTVGQCIDHLNVTSDSFLPLLQAAIEEARRRGLRAGATYRLDLVGWLFCKVLEPPYRIRARTPPAFDPPAAAAAETVLARFDHLQAALVDLVAGSDGLAIDRVRLVSPFSARVKYSAYAAFRIIAAHQRRHLWQGERVLETLA